MLSELQHYYNWERPHRYLKGLTPIEKVTELSDKTPSSEKVYQHDRIWKDSFQE
ncbi:hypothetical protein IFVP136_C210072 [Vibrio parahaemolyticus]